MLKMVIIAMTIIFTLFILFNWYIKNTKFISDNDISRVILDILFLNLGGIVLFQEIYNNKITSLFAIILFAILPLSLLDLFKIYFSNVYANEEEFFNCVEKRLKSTESTLKDIDLDKKG